MLPPAPQPPARRRLATGLVLLAGALAVALVVLRPEPPAGAPRRPSDDAEVLERVVPRAAARDAGTAPVVVPGDAADGGEVPQ